MSLPSNPHRGEVSVVLNGKPHTLCLTLSALAELEQAFAADNLSDLCARFAHGNFSARDILRVLSAGLRGGGHELTEAQIATLHPDGGLPKALEAVAQLLLLTFGGGHTQEASSDQEIRQNP
jgi:hypothetical protein